jgi:hypothetical protein
MHPAQPASSSCLSAAARHARRNSHPPSTGGADPGSAAHAARAAHAVHAGHAANVDHDADAAHAADGAARQASPRTRWVPPSGAGPLARAAAARRFARAVLLPALALFFTTPAPAAAQSPSRGFKVFIQGFDDVNGNGKVDCGEPVTVEVAYFDSPQDTTGAITGHLTSPFAGTAGLSFLHGTVQQDFTLSGGGCLGVITAGNASSDVEADLDFNCSPPSAFPIQGNAITWKYKAAFAGTTPAFTATAHGTTSDGLDQTPSVTGSLPIGTVCSGVAPSVRVGKTAAGSGAPGSVIVYTLSATDLTGLGLGGVQLTDVVPDQTTFDAAGSSAGWTCPAPGPGNLCTLPVGNLPPNGTITRVFAVAIASPLPAGVTAIANTACARQGPSLVLGCASTRTPTTGAPMLKLAKSLQSGTGAPGATLVYQLAVSNTGNQDSGPLTIDETVPANTSWNAGASAPGWACAGTAPGSSCTLQLANVPSGGSATTLYAVAIANPLPAGVTAITNTACVAGTQACGSLVTPTTGAPALSVHKSLAGTATPGATLTYTVTV